ncbi:MAG TPA: hypothetical protein VI698_00880 [Nitrososphaerales archaeon]|nr:hypothetical protein [Nitrososphaerales archaeon]
MSSIIDDIIEEAKIMYSKMSLLELLAEENIIAELLHRRARDPVRKKLQEIIRFEVERKLS